METQQKRPTKTQFDKIRHMVRQSLVTSGVRLKTAQPMAHKITLTLIDKGVLSDSILEDVTDEELKPKITKEEDDDGTEG